MRLAIWAQLLWILALCHACSLGPPSRSESQGADRLPNSGPFSYEPYAVVLGGYVDEQGRVAYGALKQGRKSLDAFAASLEALAPHVYAGWSRNEKIAFWINVYNAMTLKVIVDHYPIRNSVLRTLVYPANSIRQIPGVWDRLQFQIMGRELTLDQIEHQILRTEFEEPRIHMALVCAAVSCPPLAREPYEGSRLEAQLDAQARHFLQSPQGLQIDPESGIVRVSRIFKWYGDDFLAAYGPAAVGAALSRPERAIISFILAHVDEPVAAFLKTGEYRLEYLDYDWRLNDQARESAAEAFGGSQAVRPVGTVRSPAVSSHPA